MRIVDLFFDSNGYCCGVDEPRQGTRPIFRIKAEVYMDNELLLGTSVEDFVTDPIFKLTEGRHA